jgi:hypothetical protein
VEIMLSTAVCLVPHNALFEFAVGGLLGLRRFPWLFGFVIHKTQPMTCLVNACLRHTLGNVAGRFIFIKGPSTNHAMQIASSQSINDVSILILNLKLNVFIFEYARILEYYDDLLPRFLTGKLHFPCSGGKRSPCFHRWIPILHERVPDFAIEIIGPNVLVSRQDIPLLALFNL